MSYDNSIYIKESFMILTPRIEKSENHILHLFLILHSFVTIYCVYLIQYFSRWISVTMDLRMCFSSSLEITFNLNMKATSRIIAPLVILDKLQFSFCHLNICVISNKERPHYHRLYSIAEVRRDDFYLINWSSYLINLDE